MAFTFGFYNAFEHDRRYDAVQVSKIFDGIINDGVYASIGKCFILKVNDVTGQINVQPGRAWFDHTWSLNDADLPMKDPGPDLVNDRWDAIVLDINRSQEPDNVNGRLNKILWIKGTASTNPQKPKLIKEEEHTQYPLGYIYRKANALQINQADITNTVGTSECPFVTGIIETVHIDDLLMQWRDEWVQYFKETHQWVSDRKAETYQQLLDMVNELLNFRNNNEAYFLNWIEEMKDRFAEFPPGELYVFLDQVRNRQEEIVNMLIQGYVPTRLVDDKRNYILNDLGIPLMLSFPLCGCSSDGTSSGGGSIGDGSTGSVDIDPSIYNRLTSLEASVRYLSNIDVSHDRSISQLSNVNDDQDKAITSLEDYVVNKETSNIDFSGYFK